MKLTTLAAGGIDNTDSAVIPVGKTVVITHFGGADINAGDHKSSAYLLQWGTVGSFEELSAIALTGNTYQQELSRELVGDGAKFVRVTRQNTSATLKRCPFWVKAYDK